MSLCTHPLSPKKLNIDPSSFPRFWVVLEYRLSAGVSVLHKVKEVRGVRLCEMMRLCVVNETHGVSIVVPRVTTWRQY